MPGKPIPIKDIKDKIGIANMQKLENNSANNLVNVMCRCLSTSHTILFQSGTQKFKDIYNKDSFPIFSSFFGKSSFSFEFFEDLIMTSFFSN